jgi:predicted MFS family arabinose efflux permease
MGVYALGIPAGSLIALTAGGVLSENFGWRAAFLIAGVPGLILALVAFLTLRDPRVRQTAAQAQAQAPARSIGSSFAELRSNRVFWWLSLGSASMALVSYGQLAFFGSFFLRVHKPGLAVLSADLHQATGLTLGPVGLVGVGLGVVIGLAGLIGAFLGGQLGHWFSSKTPSALMWVPAIAAPLCVPFYVAAFLAPSAPSAFLLLFVPKLIGNVWLAPTFAALQSVVPPDVRATAAAVQSSVVLMIGLGLGPVAVGAASDALAGRGLGAAEGIRWALMGTSLVCIVAALFFAIAARAIKATKLS